MLKRPSVDPERLALIGNSFGGYLALVVAAANARYQAAAAICPLIDPAVDPIAPELFDEFAEMLHGVSGPELRAQWSALPSILIMTSQLDTRRLLLITGDRDELFPASHYEPIAAELASLRWERVPEADHAFSSSRKQLVKLSVEWLLEVVGR